MFAISTEQQQYKTYTLVDQAAEARLVVVPERGGLISHWQLQDKDILYFDAERFANPDMSVRGGIPILFPICGNLPDNQYTYEGKVYSLKQHGFGRDLPWQVVDQHTQDVASLTLELTSSEQTRSVYPFEFRLRFVYRLIGNTLEIRQTIENCCDRTMPFSIGFHPYFNVLDKTQLTFDIPAQQFQDQITQEVLPYDGTFDWEAEELDLAFKPLSRQSAQVRDLSENVQISLEFDDLYSTLVFWSVQGKDYYCLEPWSAPRNAMNTGESLTSLPPGQTQETFVRIVAELK